jgi:hypothetical protein
MIDVRLPDGQTITVNTDDPKAAAAAARRYLGKAKTDSRIEGAFADAASREPVMGTPGGALAASNTGIANAVSFGLADELVAGATAPIEALISGRSLSDAYSHNLARERAVEAVQSEAQPIASTVGEIAGGLGAGGALQRAGVSALNVARPTLGQMAGRGALEGAAYGAAYGFGEGEGGFEERARSAVNSASLGAAGGALAGAVGAKIAGKQARAAVPTTDDIKGAAQAAYAQADQAGLVVSPTSFGARVNDITTEVTREGLDRTLHPKATAALGRLRAATAQPLSLQEIDTLRRVVGGAAKSIEPDERRIASIIVGRMDDYLANLKPADVVAGNAKEAANAIVKARSLWSRMRKSEMLEEALEKAERRAASTGSGGNIDNAIRQNVRAILDNPKKARGFTKDEREALEKVVRGGPVQNVMRLVGKLSPEGNGLMAALNIGAVAMNPMMAAGTATGFAAKKIADRATPANLEKASALIRSGGVSAMKELSPKAQAFLEMMLRANAQQSPQAIGTIP